MRAYVLESYRNGGQQRWAEVAEPHVSDGQVLVDIRSAGVNPLDRMIADGTFRHLIRYRLPQVMGQEFAGIVTAVGAGVSGYQVGDRVFGRPDVRRPGTFADRIAVDVADIAPMPDGLTFAEAAGLPLVLLTAAQAFTETVRVTPGDKVFIQGGTGGLGSMAVQVAAYLGATVATTVSSPSKDLARQLGAEVVIDYHTERYEDVLRDYDVVLDTLGGGETVRAMSVLRPGGTLISVVGPPDPGFARDLGRPLLAPVMRLLSARVRRAAGKRGLVYRFLFMRANGRQLADYTPAVESGRIRPVIGHTVGIGDLTDALGLSASGHSRPGKIVVVAGE